MEGSKVTTPGSKRHSRFDVLQAFRQHRCLTFAVWNLRVWETILLETGGPVRSSTVGPSPRRHADSCPLAEKSGDEEGLEKGKTHLKPASSPDTISKNRHGEEMVHVAEQVWKKCSV
ncbi:hypothetical protein EYF80_049714 [Liparis tanakae]|uniref:Uncharacterized protein n=1 Tax=Liparis tanakae TaxID=230148 RepID=A0A4Z2FGR3_9TELE|nr:hypothetical protein EYF80_049714 [Liparis tanakae]